MLPYVSMQKYGRLKIKNLQNLSLPHKRSFGLSHNPTHYEAQGRLHGRIVAWDQAPQLTAFLCHFTSFFPTVEPGPMLGGQKKLQSYMVIYSFTSVFENADN